ncbi:GFA family protein [Sphingobium sp.]|uniref:GFA family protein n=1 Tax=Sphingobium sp. TaxID=1912891 RepID=UPI002ED55144
MSEVGLEATHEGGCACGAVRYRLEGEPIFVNNCHCSLCQRQSGTGSVFNGLYESDRVTLLSGDLTRHSVTTGSGKLQEMVRCAACGTAVWSHYPRMGRFGAAIRLGTLDDPGVFTPDAVIYVTTKLPWVAVSEDMPQFEEGYDFKAVLPQHRLARLYALAGRVKEAAGADAA